MTDPTTATPVQTTRHDGRSADQTREVRITRNWLDHAEGSVLVEFGRTRVLCAASFTEGVPRWLKRGLLALSVWVLTAVAGQSTLTFVQGLR